MSDVLSQLRKFVRADRVQDWDAVLKARTELFAVMKQQIEIAGHGDDLGIAIVTDLMDDAFLAGFVAALEFDKALGT